MIHQKNLVGDLPIHVAKKHFAPPEVVASLMPVAPEATGAERNRDPDALVNKIRDFERGDLLTLDRALATQPLPDRRPMSPHSETRPIGSPRAESTGRPFSESEQYWQEHSVLSRTGSVKKIMGENQETLSAEEEARRTLVLVQTRLGSLPPYEGEVERLAREQKERDRKSHLTLDTFLMRHDPDPARAMNVLLSWTKDPKAQDAACFIQCRARGFLARAGMERHKREWLKNNGIGGHETQGYTCMALAAATRDRPESRESAEFVPSVSSLSSVETLKSGMSEM